MGHHNIRSIGLDLRDSGGGGVRYGGRTGSVHWVGGDRHGYCGDRHGHCVRDGSSSWEHWSSREHWGREGLDAPQKLSVSFGHSVGSVNPDQVAMVGEDLQNGAGLSPGPRGLAGLILDSHVTPYC